MTGGQPNNSGPGSGRKRAVDPRQQRGALFGVRSAHTSDDSLWLPAWTAVTSAVGQGLVAVPDATWDCSRVNSGRATEPHPVSTRAHRRSPTSRSGLRRAGAGYQNGGRHHLYIPR